MRLLSWLGLLAALGATDAKVTVTGEVVETSCYVRMGARGEAHKKCAELCANNGIPLAVLDEDHDAVVWIGADDHQKNPNDLLRKFIARRVTVKGHYVERSGVRLLIAESVEPAGTQ
ncbi:MAG TPA: hypothetical protein VJS92_16425 [Candidatus Polarisedimenticolaceae bacterium]|nr:hypothetical protein [Candidatus Polarisedimenticolaceae bacterium]